MQNKKCALLFQENPVIASVRNPKDIYKAVDSQIRIIFLLTGNIYNLGKMVEYCLASDKLVFVHLDLLKGYAEDHYFIRYLKEEINPTGVISTKNTAITRAKQEGLLTIQRMFLLDSAAVESAVISAKKIRPDAIEVLPALIPKMIHRIKEAVDLPIITGGFVETEAEVRSCIEAGALSVSTSREELWNKCAMCN